jgi:hypothetical protein
MSNMGRFILSTGRAGSTLLSRMLSENRHTLVLSEFLGACDNARRFPEGEVTGETFAEILSRADDLSALLRYRAFNHKELLIDPSKESPRWGHPAKIPTMLIAPVPYLDPDHPEELYDAMLAFAKGLPAQRIGLHYQALWDWLTERYGKSAWIERSGSNIRYSDEIIREFPEGRYVHLHRDGVSAALSMREHAWFVLAVEYDLRPPSDAEIEKALAEVGTGDDDAVGRYFGKDKPGLDEFGRHWTWQIARGYREFIKLDRHQFLAVGFEEVQANPERELKRIADFFELPQDEGWEKRAGAIINPSLGKRSHDLPQEELAAVTAAVTPGQLLTGRAEPSQLIESYHRLRAVFDRQS